MKVRITYNEGDSDAPRITLANGLTLRDGESATVEVCEKEQADHAGEMPLVLVNKLRNNPYFEVEDEAQVELPNSDGWDTPKPTAKPVPQPVKKK